MSYTLCNQNYVRTLKKLAAGNIKTVYPGNDPLIIAEGEEVIRSSPMNLKRSIHNICMGISGSGNRDYLSGNGRFPQPLIPDPYREE
jgi:hypothetical protein